MKMRHLQNEAETLALGRELAGKLAPGDVIALRGGLGVGKTTLVRGVIQALIGDVEVPSPTYTLVQTYDAPDFEIWHCDLYRLESPDDILELGLLDAMEDCAVFIEWPEQMGHYLPDRHRSIEIMIAETGRDIQLLGWQTDRKNNDRP